MSLYSFAEYNRLISRNNKVIIACPLPREVIQIQHMQGVVCPTYPLGFKNSSSHISALKISSAHYFGEIKPGKCHGSNSAEISVSLSGVVFTTFDTNLFLPSPPTDIQICSASSVYVPAWN